MYLKAVYTIFFITIIILFAKANNENYPLGARSSGIANSSVSLSDTWSAHHNQAGLGFIRDVSTGVFYENRFFLKEISAKGGVIALPLKAGTFGLCITNFGYSLYSENKYCFSFAKAFGDNFSAAVSMDYLNTRIAEGYGTNNTFVAEAGIQAKPLKELTIGAHIFNPTRTKLADYTNERIPTIIRLGGNYNFSDKVLLAIETEKDISKKAIFKAGVEYKAIKEFYLRAGIATNPTLSCFGFGINIKNLKIDVAANYHQVLGISPQLSLTYSFKKSESKSDNSAIEK